MTTLKNPTYTQPIECGYCVTKVPLQIGAVYNHAVIDEESTAYLGFTEIGPQYTIAVCPSCNGVNLLAKDHLTPSGRAKTYVLYPHRSNIIRGLPEKINSAYQAALRVRSIDTNGYAVLLGRVLDLLCADRLAVGASLFDRLSNLSQRGEIPQPLAEMANQLRQLRNIGAHADLGELSNTEVPILDSLCKAILEYVYGAPLLIKTVQLSIDEHKRKRSKAEK